MPYGGYTGYKQRVLGERGHDEQYDRARLLSDRRLSIVEDIDAITSTALKDYLVVDFSEDDALLDRLQRTAIEHFERSTSVYIRKQMRLAEYDHEAYRYPLYAAPFVSLDGLFYVDEGQRDDDVSADYFVRGRRPAYVTRKRGSSTGSVHTSIEIEYTAGYETTEDVPDDIQTTIAKMVGDLYEYRASVTTGESVNDLPVSFGRLLAPHKIYRM